MLRRRCDPPPLSGTRWRCWRTTRVGLLLWDTVALRLLWTEVEGRGRTNQASPQRAVLLMLCFLRTKVNVLFSHRFMVKHLDSTTGSKYGRHFWKQLPQVSLVGFYSGGLLLRCDWLPKRRIEPQTQWTP